jgi:glycosyltransferase involved in cell wall biosynthesis
VPAVAGAPATVTGPRRQPVFAFAGTINSPGYVALLRRLVAATAREQSRVVLYGPITQQQALESGLALPNVTIAGLLAPEELQVRLQQDADVLFVPMSFHAADRPNMRMGFPSKLTDYTAVGLPLLIYGPDDCSAVRWARDNHGVAELVTTDDDQAIGAAVKRLTREPQYRATLAAAARRVGDRDFSADTAAAIFHGALLSAVGRS